MRPFRKIHSTNSEMTQLQANVDEVFRAIGQSPFSDGVMIEGIIFTSPSSLTRQIAHKLPRVPRGWIVVDRTGAATLHRTAWDEKFITLVAASSLTCSIWVF